MQRLKMFASFAGFAVVAALAGAPVLGSAMASSAPAAVTATVDSGNGDLWNPKAKDRDIRAAAYISTYRVGLSHGEVLDPRNEETRFHTTTTVLDGNIGSRTLEFEPSEVAAEPAATLAWRAQAPLGWRPVSTVIYRIWSRGVETNYWVQMTVNNVPGAGIVTCEIFEDYPRAGHAVLVSNGPFRCDYSVDIDWYPRKGEGDAIRNVSFHVTTNRTAEASGTIIAKPSHGISLTDGAYAFNNVPQSTAGSSEIKPGSSTAFDTVLTPVDSPTDSNLAKAEFIYRIVTEERFTGAGWVVGYSQNGTGGLNRGESGCFITDEDPNGRPWQQARRSNTSDYQCTIEYTGPVNRDRDHYSATFTIEMR